VYIGTYSAGDLPPLEVERRGVNESPDALTEADDASANVEAAHGGIERRERATPIDPHS
jgi:hypothetical protein